MTCLWCSKEAKIPYEDPKYYSMDHRTLHISFRDKFETVKRIEAEKPKIDMPEFKRQRAKLTKSETL